LTLPREAQRRRQTLDLASLLVRCRSLGGSAEGHDRTDRQQRGTECKCADLDPPERPRVVEPPVAVAAARRDAPNSEAAGECAREEGSATRRPQRHRCDANDMETGGKRDQCDRSGAGGPRSRYERCRHRRPELDRFERIYRIRRFGDQGRLPGSVAGRESGDSIATSSRSLRTSPAARLGADVISPSTDLAIAELWPEARFGTERAA
jgi:hypothetical protein